MHTFHQCDYMYTGDDDGRMIGSFFCNRSLSTTNMEHSPICSLAGDELTRATFAAASAKQGMLSPPVESFNMVYTKTQVERGAVWRSSTAFTPPYVLLIVPNYQSIYDKVGTSVGGCRHTRVRCNYAHSSGSRGYRGMTTPILVVPEATGV